jgi:hypothetical protein
MYIWGSAINWHSGTVTSTVILTPLYYLQQNGYIYVVTHLDRFQTPTGGFSHVEGGRASLEATSNALFLSSLFGLRKKVLCPLILAFT